MSPARATWLPHLILRKFITTNKVSGVQIVEDPRRVEILSFCLPPVTSGEVFPFSLVDPKVILSSFLERKPKYCPGSQREPPTTRV